MADASANQLVKSMDALWEAKVNGVPLYEEGPYEPIHMPNNSGQPFILGVIMFFLGFFLVFSWFIPAIIAGIAVVVMLALRSFERDHGYHISPEEIAATEQKLRGDSV